ncbi:GTP-binding protein [Dermabacteraceae bacterium P13136]
MATTPISLLAAIDPVLRDALSANLLMDQPGLVVLRHELDANAGTLRRLVLDAGGIVEDEQVYLEHPCAGCAVREDAIPTLQRLVDSGRWDAVLFALPVGADALMLARALDGAVEGAHLSPVAAIVDADAAVRDILGDDTLAERGLGMTQDDERSVGEALCSQLEYADVLILCGDMGTAGDELIEHLRAHDTLGVRGIHTLDPGILFTGEHNPESASHRCDPRTVQPWGGPTAHGTWTLDLSSKRPFHPDRLLKHIERLGSGKLRSRGRFWVPTRPGTICQWDGAGGQVSIGSYSSSGRELPTTRLIVTGIDPADRQRVADAFRDCLLTDEEWEQGLLPWLGRPDPLSPWLGERSRSA